MRRLTLAGLTALGLLSLTCYICNTTGYDEDVLMKSDKPVIIAHRGASGYCPENSLAAIAKALELNAAAIEIDVRLSRDGVVLLMHDKTIDRTTNGTGPVDGMDFQDLRQYDAGSWYGEAFHGERIPTLEDVISLIGGRAVLMIDIKGDDDGPAIARKVVDIVNQQGAAGWCRVMAFDDDILWFIRKYDPSIALCKLFVGKVPCLPFYVDDGINGRSLDDYGFVSAIGINDWFLTRKQTALLKQKGFKLYVWTVNDRSHAEEFLNTGVDAILSDYPDILSK